MDGKVDIMDFMEDSTKVTIHICKTDMDIIIIYHIVHINKVI